MAETHETIADIIAEKRRQADEIERDVAEKMKRNAMISDRYARELVADIRREADRLEAAHRRELSKNVSKNGADFGQLGDAAKLREALALIATIEFPHNFQNERFDIADACQDLTNAIKTADAALAAPPRNCDRPECATTKAAQDVWRREDGGKTAYYEWLLATTTKEEGGNNAD